jgi:methyltransferase (TIGR00027 family)
MADNQAGVTALVTAYARAYHATHESPPAEGTPKIFDDFLADQMYTPAEHAEFDRNLAGMVGMVDPELAATNPDPETALAAVMQLLHCPVTLSRSRFTEDCLDAALQQGVSQYVILGAGLDTFAFRRPDLASRLQIFEVDHPVTQALKRERAALAGWVLPPHLHLVPANFAQESLSEALARSTYNLGQPTFFSWLGVTFYLPREVVFGTLGSLATLAPCGSQIVFDYMDLDSFVPEKTARRTALMHQIAQMVGEPMKAGFDPQVLAAELNQVGFDLVENLTPAEIDQRYFQGRPDRYRAFEHVHFARAAVA